LDVRGDIRIGNGSSSEQDIRFVSLNGDWQVGTNNGGNGTNNNQFYFYDSAYRLTIQTGTGNIGIGTSSPTQLLELKKTTGSAIALLNYNDSVKFNINASSAGVGYVGMVSNHDLLFVTNDTERARVTSTGCVGIGTTSVRLNSLLTVYGSGAFGTSAYGFYVGTDATGAFLDAGTQLIRLFAGQQERIRIQSDGNVGIGTSSPTYVLDVNSANDSAIRIRNGAGSANNGLALAVGSGTPWLDITEGAEFRIKGNTYANLGTWNSGNNTKILINSSGNVGIGTTSPTAKLHVQSGGILAKGATTPNLNLEPSGSLGNADVSFDGTSFILVSNSSSADLRLSTNSTARLTILAGGNVGIGTTSPSYKLDVNSGSTSFALRLLGSSVDGPVIRLENTASGGRIYHVGSTATGSGAGTGFSIYDVTGSSARMLIDANGNVGIGTTSPSQLLEVAGSSPIIRVLATSGNATLRLTDNGVRNWDLKVVDTSDYFEVGGTNTTSLIVTGAGNVGIGTSSPGVKLDVVGGVRSFSSSGNYGLITNGSFQAVGDHGGTYMLDLDNTGAADLVNIKKSGTSRFYITNGGNVGVGTTGPAAKLAVSGNLFLLGVNAQRQYTYFAIGSASDDIWLRSSSSFANNGASASINLSRLTYQSAGSGNDLNDKVGIWLRGFYDNSGGGLPIYLGGYAYSSQIPAVTITGLNSDGSGGNLGIGTTSPSNNLVVYNGSGWAGEDLNGTSGGELRFLQSGTLKANIYASTSTGFVLNGGSETIFQIGASEKMRLTGANLGIGTTGPVAFLDIVGNGIHTILRNTSATSYTSLRLYNDQNSAVRALEIDYSGASYSGALITSGPTGESACVTTTGAYPLAFGTNNTARMTILSGGNVGIGTSSPTQKLEVNGTIKATSFVGPLSRTSTTQTITGNSALTIDVSAAYIHIITVAASGGVFGISSVTYNNRKADPEVDEIILIFKWPASGSGSINISNTIGDIPFNYGKATVSRLTSYKGTTGLWIAETVASNIDYTNL
jgi:hypothetical protein